MRKGFWLHTDIPVVFAKWLRDKGLNAASVQTEYEGDAEENDTGAESTHFATLFKQLDQTTKTTVKVEALVDFFKKAPDRDKLWAIAILSIVAQNVPLKPVN
ncbi:MAG: hypothetical protein R2784_04685 [Saprospiraceae bacterium]